MTESKNTPIEPTPEEITDVLNKLASILTEREMEVLSLVANVMFS